MAFHFAVELYLPVVLSFEWAFGQMFFFCQRSLFCGGSIFCRGSQLCRYIYFTVAFDFADGVCCSAGFHSAIDFILLMVFILSWGIISLGGFILP